MPRWMVMAKKADFKKIAETFGISQITARLLRNRDIIGDEAIRTYLEGDLSGLHDGRKMLDMERAAGLVAEAVRADDRIRIIGDYDVDGICASYILCRGLAEAGSTKTDTTLPDRIRDGYGLNENLVRQAAADGVQMLLTCDNGISAISEIALAKELGMRVVVTDHHKPGRDGDTDRLPPADAVVDPSRDGDPYPYPTICGAVVAWKFVSLLLSVCRPDAQEQNRELLEDLLPFAAFATNCDVMPLADENRIIMRYGIRRIAEGRNAGLSELIRACGLREDAVQASDFGFKLGPCLNSTGRLDSAQRGLKLLLTTNRTDAARIAGDLVALNDERKILTENSLRKACEEIDAGGYEEDSILVVYLADCHESLAGIIAGKLRERYGKPAAVFTDSAEADIIKGSARSVPGFDIFKALAAQERLLTKYGGHEQAAGMSIHRDDLEVLRRELNENNHLQYDPVLHIDMELPLSHLSLELIKQFFSVLEPCGKGNAAPLFFVKNITFFGGRLFGRNGNVGKYTVRDSEGKEFELKMFQGMIGRFHELLTERFGAQILTKLYDGFAREALFVCHVAYHPQINVYQGLESMQFQVADVIIK